MTHIYGAHPEVLPLIGWNIKPDGHFVLVTELMPHGCIDPKSLIFTERMSSRDRQRSSISSTPKQKLELNPTARMILIYGIASGFKYLHERRVIHRDIKPGNIFLDERNYPRIGDLGLAKMYLGGEQTGTAGSGEFMAPEIFQKQAWGYPVDVFAFGMTCYVILTSHRWAQDFTERNLVQRIAAGHRPKDLADSIGDSQLNKLVNKMWSSDPNERPTFPEIVAQLEDPALWISGVDEGRLRKYIDSIKKEKFPAPPSGLAACLEKAKQSWTVERQMPESDSPSVKFAAAVGIICGRNSMEAKEIQKFVEK
jgi:serine/threonine protein kinase